MKDKIPGSEVFGKQLTRRSGFWWIAFRKLFSIPVICKAVHSGAGEGEDRHGSGGEPGQIQHVCFQLPIAGALHLYEN